MKLIKHDPWNTFARMQDEISRYFPRSMPQWFPELEQDEMMANWAPAVDVTETDKEYLVKADIPGVAPEDIDLSLEEGVLTIRGDRQETKTEESEENGYRRTERFAGSFYRRFALPGPVDETKIKAQGKDGVLEVHIPKTQPRKAKRIKVER